MARMPNGLGTSGRRLWTQVTADYKVAGELQLILREACRTLDLCDVLQGDVDGAEGAERRRIAAELRAQRTTFANLVKALELRDDNVTAKPGGRLAHLQAGIPQRRK